MFEPSVTAYQQASGNPRGLQTWWHSIGATDTPTYEPGDAFPNTKQFRQLVARMERIYDTGIRRIILQLPAGAPFGAKGPLLDDGVTRLTFGHDFSMNHWHAMSEWKREVFGRADGPFQVWLAQKNNGVPINSPNRVYVELYTAAPVSDGLCTQTVNIDPTDLEWPYDGVNVEFVPLFIDGGVVQERFCWVTGQQSREEAVDFDPRRPEHIEYVLHHMSPWYGVGVSRFWMDGAVNNQASQVVRGRARWGMLELAYMPGLKSLGYRFGIEAVPVAGDNQFPDFCSISKVPTLGLSDQAMSNHGNPNTREFWPNWIFSRANTEVHFVPSPGNMSYRHFREARRRGLVVTVFNCMDEVECERVKRIYSMGNVWIPDFNGDGEVTELDAFEFEIAWAQPFDIKTYAYGDMDDDRDRDSTDYSDFYIAYGAEFRKRRAEANLIYVRPFGLPDDL